MSYANSFARFRQPTRVSSLVPETPPSSPDPESQPTAASRSTTDTPAQTTRAPTRLPASMPPSTTPQRTQGTQSRLPQELPSNAVVTFLHKAVLSLLLYRADLAPTPVLAALLGQSDIYFTEISPPVQSLASPDPPPKDLPLPSASSSEAVYHGEPQRSQRKHHR